MRRWRRGGTAMTPAMQAKIAVHVPSYTVYVIIEAMAHRLATSKHINPVR